MAKNLNEIEFILSEPISIHKGGSLAPVNTLLLKAPSNANRYYLIKLKQGFMKALMGMQSLKNDNKAAKPSKVKDVSNNEDDNLIDGKFIAPILLASDIDFCEYLGIFKDYLCNGICLVEGNIPLNPHLFDQISMEDTELLLGKYIESFLLSSWTKSLNQE